MFLDLVGKCINEANLVFRMNTRYLRFSFVLPIMFYCSLSKLCYLKKGGPVVLADRPMCIVWQLKTSIISYYMPFRLFCCIIWRCLTENCMTYKKHSETWQTYKTLSGLVKTKTGVLGVSRGVRSLTHNRKIRSLQNILSRPHNVSDWLTATLNRWPSASCLCVCRSYSGCDNHEEVA